MKIGLIASMGMGLYLSACGSNSTSGGPGSGGATFGVGGSLTATGGATLGTGGAILGAGGIPGATGGARSGTGGIPVGTGGVLSGTGGTSMASGGMTGSGGSVATTGTTPITVPGIGACILSPGGCAEYLAGNESVLAAAQSTCTSHGYVWASACPSGALGGCKSATGSNGIPGQEILWSYPPGTFGASSCNAADTAVNPDGSPLAMPDAGPPFAVGPGGPVSAACKTCVDGAYILSTLSTLCRSGAVCTACLDSDYAAGSCQNDTNFRNWYNFVCLSATTATCASTCATECGKGTPLGDASIGGMDGSAPDVSVGSLDGGIADATAVGGEAGGVCSLAETTNATCNALANGAQNVPLVSVTSAQPVGNGGPIFDGLYFLTGSLAYPGAIAGARGTLRRTMQFCGHSAQLVYDDASTATLRQNFTINPSGHFLLPGATCSSDGILSANIMASSFEATPTTITFYDYANAFALIYTKQ